MPVKTMKPFRVEQTKADNEAKCFAVIGPDRCVWHESWSDLLLVKLAAKYNQIYEMGVESVLLRVDRAAAPSFPPPAQGTQKN